MVFRSSSMSSRTLVDVGTMTTQTVDVGTMTSGAEVEEEEDDWPPVMVGGKRRRPV